MYILYCKEIMTLVCKTKCYRLIVLGLSIWMLNLDDWSEVLMDKLENSCFHYWPSTLLFHIWTPKRAQFRQNKQNHNIFLRAYFIFIDRLNILVQWFLIYTIYIDKSLIYDEHKYQDYLQNTRSEGPISHILQ